jgi:hypothetical protein
MAMTASAKPAANFMPNVQFTIAHPFDEVA